MKITLKQLKQLIKEEVSRKMLLEYEEAVIINPETGAILKVNDENQSREVGQAEEGNSEHIAFPGYEQWEEGGFKRSGGWRGGSEDSWKRRRRADEMEVDW